MPIFCWCLPLSRVVLRLRDRAGLVRPVPVLLVLGLMGCHDLTGSQSSLPTGTENPAIYANAAGALAMRNAAVIAVATALPGDIVNTGLLTDELTDLSVFASPGTNVANAGAVNDPVDERLLPEQPYGEGTNLSDAVYDDLQGARGALAQAIGQLATYDSSARDTAVLKPAVDRVLRGELYALEGYAEIMLADFFCSGIPLSTLDFQKNLTYRAGSTTAQVYQDALAKFDTALALSADSARIQNLARVGQGRAYLDLGQATVAADDVALVPTGFQYQFLLLLSSSSSNVINASATVSDREGGNGLPFLSDGDPRTADTTIQDSAYQVGYPQKYIPNLLSAAPITLADWVEARLIQAEAALQAGDVPTWLSLLNQLRATAPIPGTTQPQPNALPPLTDPGLSSPNPDSARVTLTFAERAAWLYLTGHRQGDLRRLLRQYPQFWPDQIYVYPTGTYLGLGTGRYGIDVTAPIPGAEYINPLFQGCLNRAP